MAVSDVQKLRVLIEDLVRRVANAPNVLPEMHCSKRLAELLTLLNRLGVDGQPYTYLRYRPERRSDGGIIFHPLGEYTFEFCEPPPMGEIGDVGQSWKLTAPIDQGTIAGESAREVARDALAQLRNWLSWAQSLPDDGYSSGAITVRMLKDVDPENLVSKSEATSPRENRRPTMESRVGYIKKGDGTEPPRTTLHSTGEQPTEPPDFSGTQSPEFFVFCWEEGLRKPAESKESVMKPIFDRWKQGNGKLTTGSGADRRPKFSTPANPKSAANRYRAALKKALG